MVNRILLGNRNGSMGIWVSKPGVDVLTGDFNGMLIMFGSKSLQIIQSGVVVWGTASFIDIPVPSTGEYPRIVLDYSWLSPTPGAVVSYPNLTTIRITRGNTSNYTTPVNYMVITLKGAN
ncbi:hypothetical protein [Agrobacterium sp. CG674]